MTFLDWTIVAGMVGIILAGVAVARSASKSVADFLAAGRSAGRYVISLSQGMAGLGAITIVGLFEMNYVAGFSMSWWGLTMNIVVLAISVSGWVIYRFRRTRSLTLAEFFERRYSRRFRIFSGGLAFASGLVNFGIFPAVGARFFIHYCGLPTAVSVFGLGIPTFPATMALLLGLSVYLVLSGGQVAVILTDFIQGLFANIVFIILTIYLMVMVPWDAAIEALSAAPTEASLVHPFHTSHVEDFNFWYFLIGIFGVLYGAMSWQGTQGYNASATSAHEAKMAGILGNWRGFPQGTMLLMVPILAYTVMNHGDFVETATVVNGTLEGIGSEALQNQARVPLVLTTLLPPGLLGAFAAVMLAAFISTHDTYLHSWASIFVQDIWLPLRGRPASPAEHLRLLRLAVCGVAVFIFFFSLLFQQSEYIFLFFAITGAIFAGGSGAVIIGGLYWRRGTAPAAWTALLTGAIISVGGILIHQVPQTTIDAGPGGTISQAVWPALTWLYEINGQQYWALGMFASSILYIVVSLLGPAPTVDFDRLLRGGEHTVRSETPVVETRGRRGWRMLGIGHEFTRGDKIITASSYAWTLTWTLVFAAGTVYNLTHDVSQGAWIRFWHTYVRIHLAISVFVLVWFAVGGISDIRKMLGSLARSGEDTGDDGQITATS